jgi:hypothetical protein
MFFGREAQRVLTEPLHGEMPGNPRMPKKLLPVGHAGDVEFAPIMTGNPGEGRIQQCGEEPELPYETAR